ncbi:32025_t:CDS:2 [Gigaspora margarita]|uniref:32025_t:CDS:1 n=1 Tax=Gigaspora margarita TaxID=4874 RepID=A0ABN7W9J4_GIGMA|nr:32025_t:CDS:2 [Gigaspora margarita]
MPCYTNTEPDSFNLDTLLSKHGDKLRVVTCNKNAKNLKVLSNNFNPQQCTDKEGFHFFMISRQPTIITCFCKKYHTYFASKTLTIQSNLPNVLLTPAEASSSGMEIDLNINIYNNLSKVEKSPYQPRHNITQPFSVSFDNTPRSNTTQYKAHSHHAHTCIICKIKDIPCIILQNEKHSLDPNALTLKNQQLGFPAHPQCLHQLKLKPIQQQKPLKCRKLLPSSYTPKSIASLKQRSNETRKCALFHLHTCNQNTCDISVSKDDHNLKSLSSHYFKDSFNTFLAPEDTPGKTWTFPGLEIELFNPNQPNSATFSKPTPITQLRELATRTAKKFAEENQVTETTERHTHYFYCYLKAYLKAAANNDGIKEMDCDKTLQHVINSDTNSHTLARIIAFYDIQSQFKISIKNIKKKYSTDYLPQTEEFIINYYKITTLDANDNALFFSPKPTEPETTNNETIPPFQ